MPVAKKMFNKIMRKVGKAIGDFDLISAGDRIAVGVSGGKDSYVLLHTLEALRQKAPLKFELVAINIDAGFPNYHTEQIENHLNQYQFDYCMATTAGYQIITEKLKPGSSYCSFCARLRRGALHSQAEKLGCNKIALGHHLDDFIETLLLNQFYGGTLSAMSAKMEASKSKHTIIRPLVYVEEATIKRYSDLLQFPIIHCACPAIATTNQKRVRMKQLISTLAMEIPEIRSSMIAAIGNVNAHNLLDCNFSQAKVKTSSHDYC